MQHHRTRTAIRSTAASLASVGAIAGLLVLTGAPGTSAADPASPVVSSTTPTSAAPPQPFSALEGGGASSSTLPPELRAAVAELGSGFARSLPLGDPRTAQARADGLEIARGRGAVRRIDHPAGITVVLATSGSTMCALEVSRLGGPGGGSCGPADLDPLAPPVSVTTEQDGERVVGLLPDGARDVRIVARDGSELPVYVERNVAAGIAPTVAAVTWVDVEGVPRRVSFSAGDGAGDEARRERAAELADLR